MTVELRKREPIGDSLPMLFRDFEVLEMISIPKREKKVLTPEEVVARAARRERVKVARAAGKEPDPADANEEDDDAEAEESSQDTGNQSEESQGKRDEDRFNISISSEFPVERWFGTEILDHSPEAIDLSRAKKGLSFLDSHDYKSIVGIVEKVKVGDDKKLRGVLRFSRSAPAQQVKTDIQDKIRRFISVGYQVREYVLEKSSKEEGDTYRATKWAPMEASSVGVPADPTVGHERAAEGERRFPVLVRAVNQPAERPNSKEGNVDPVITLQESRSAAAEIVRLGKVHGIDQEKVAQAVADGKTVDAFSREVLTELEKRGAAPLPQPGAERLDLTDKEQKEYNLARGIMAAVTNIERASGGSAGKRENTFEMEISEQIEKTWKAERHGGLFVPWSLRHAWTPELQTKYGDAVSKRAGGGAGVALAAGTSTGGAELVFVEPGEFIQFLYNRMRVRELGARTIAGLRDNVSFPKQTGKATGSWVGENPGQDVGDSAVTLGAIPSSPKTYQSSSSYSRQLLAQAVIDVDTLVREDLGRDMALAVDSVAIVGGGSNQPTGIVPTSGVQSYETIAGVAGGHNGGILSWDDIIIMSEKLEDANADQLGDGGWLTTPGIKSSLKRTARLGNVIGLPIWADDNTVDGFRARSSNQVAKNNVQGTSGANCHTLIRGVFETMIIAMWGSGFELVVDPYRLKKQGMIELTTFMLTDVVLKYPLAFVVAKYVLTT
jgi:HK97 family phage major capsid protein